MSDLKHVKGISLDAAGTLFEVAEPVSEVYARIAAAHGGELDPAAIADGFRQHFPTMSPMAFGNPDSGALQRLERGWWRTLVRRVVSGSGQLDEFDAFFDDLYEHYAAPSAWQLFDEVPSVLASMRELGLPIVVLSNFDSRLEAVSAGLGLDDMVDAVLHSTSIGAAKPAPAAFEAAVERLGHPAAACLHVGDSKVADLDGATAAGLESRLLDRRPPAKHNRKLAVVGALSELINNLR